MDEQQENTGIPGKTSQIELKDIMQECMNAPGYIIFVGTMRSEKGDPVIDFKYRRYNMNIEDAKLASNTFNKHVLDDLDAM